MNGVFVNIKSKSDRVFIFELIKKLGYKATVLSDEEMEDYAFGKAIYETKNSEKLTVAEAKVFYKKLKKAK